MAGEMQTGQEHATAVGLKRPGPYRIPVPPSVLSETAVDAGETVVLRLEVTDRFPRLVCEPADGTDGDAVTPDGNAVMRTRDPVTRALDARAGERQPHLTLPKAAVEAGGFLGRQALPYAEPGENRLYVGLSRPPGLDEVALTATETARLSRYRSGELVVSVSESVAGPLAVADRLVCWFDHADGQPVFVFGAPGVAPEGAIERTVNPNTGRDDQPGLSVYFPRLLGRLCGVTGGRLRWGLTADGNRLLGVPVDG